MTLEDEAQAARVHAREEREAIQQAIHESKKLGPADRCGVLVQEFPDAGVTDIRLSPVVPYGMIWRQKFKGDPPDQLQDPTPAQIEAAQPHQPSGLIVPGAQQMKGLHL